MNTIIHDLEKLRSNSSYLVICPKPYENNWRGVYSATINLFPNSTFQIPQYFSNSVYSEEELKSIAHKVVALGFEKVIFSGFPLYFESLINLIAENSSSKTPISIVYHGSLASNSEDKTNAKILSKILTLTQEKKVDSLAFIKKGMKETFERLVQIPSHHLLLKSPTLSEIDKLYDLKHSTHIGIFTHELYRKNLHNQVVAAYLLKSSKVHVRKGINFDYLPEQNRLVVHEFFKDYQQFLSYLGSMSVNLYVSFSECWGQVITESLALGVPCLAAYSSGVFDYSEELKNWLVVDDFDNSEAIYQKIEAVLENREEIGRKGKTYITKLNTIADEYLQQFLEV